MVPKSFADCSSKSVQSNNFLRTVTLTVFDGTSRHGLRLKDRLQPQMGQSVMIYILRYFRRITTNYHMIYIALFSVRFKV